MREPVEQFMDLKARIIDARGRMLMAIKHQWPVEVIERLGEMLGHLGGTLLRLEDSPAGLRFDEVEG